MRYDQVARVGRWEAALKLQSFVTVFAVSLCSRIMAKERCGREVLPSCFRACFRDSWHNADVAFARGLRLLKTSACYWNLSESIKCMLVAKRRRGTTLDIIFAVVQLSTSFTECSRRCSFLAWCGDVEKWALDETADRYRLRLALHNRW